MKASELQKRNGGNFGYEDQHRYEGWGMKKHLENIFCALVAAAIIILFGMLLLFSTSFLYEKFGFYGFFFAPFIVLFIVFLVWSYE